ncbi:hypothetical protein ANO11243_042430 [Dothideomycetidae sp. 11243]|nr:hypothetical protein ANO11243_042430 [fungal sp. No.11243]
MSRAQKRADKAAGESVSPQLLYTVPAYTPAPNEEPAGMMPQVQPATTPAGGLGAHTFDQQRHRPVAQPSMNYIGLGGHDPAQGGGFVPWMTAGHHAHGYGVRTCMSCQIPLGPTDQTHCVDCRVSALPRTPFNGHQALPGVPYMPPQAPYLPLQAQHMPFQAQQPPVQAPYWPTQATHIGHQAPLMPTQAPFIPQPASYYPQYPGAAAGHNPPAPPPTVPSPYPSGPYQTVGMERQVHHLEERRRDQGDGARSSRRRDASPLKEIKRPIEAENALRAAPGTRVHRPCSYCKGRGWHTAAQNHLREKCRWLKAGDRRNAKIARERQEGIRAPRHKKVRTEEPARAAGSASRQTRMRSLTTAIAQSDDQRSPTVVKEEEVPQSAPQEEHFYPPAPLEGQVRPSSMKEEETEEFEEVHTAFDSPRYEQ